MGDKTDPVTTTDSAQEEGNNESKEPGGKEGRLAIADDDNKTANELQTQNTASEGTNIKVNIVSDKHREASNANPMKSNNDQCNNENPPISESDASNMRDSRENSKTPKPKVKKPRKSIFISYSPDAGYLERKFVSEFVRQLKENNLAEDIWFDKDEQNTDSPSWFSMRMEAIEKCRAVVMVLSDSYFSCPVSVYEGKTVMERLKLEPSSVKLFPVLYSQIDNAEIAKQFAALMKRPVDLTTSHAKKSVAEKTSIVIGQIMEDLEKFGSLNASSTPLYRMEAEMTGEYLNKKICQWTEGDLQEWLFNLGIKEFYLQNMAENTIDGFLLLSLTDYDMIHYLGIDSRVVRRKIMQQILGTLDKEHKQPDNWHLRARAQRTKEDVVYLIYDPSDVRLVQNIKADLRRKNIQVIHHDSQKLGKSKDEFLRINGPHIATATNVVVVMTKAATTSPFVYHEVLFSDWLGKKLVTTIFKNTWNDLRPSLKAVLGDCPAIDFEKKVYNESLDVLVHHVKPLRRVPGVVLEQSYLNKMAEGLKPFEVLSSSRNGVRNILSPASEPQVFISYQWDMHTRVDEIRSALEKNGFVCWADINISRSSSSRSSRASTSHVDTTSVTLQGQIHKTMKESMVVLSCITPKYLQSDNCTKDLTLAETFNKPIIPLLLRFTPLDSAPLPVRKILSRHSCVDLSNERLYKQNINVVLDKVKKLLSPR